MTSDNQPLTFTGTETGFLDDQGRLVLPQMWREALAGREIGIFLLSDGEDEHRLVVYPCPDGMPSAFHPEPNPAWGDVPLHGEFQHRADLKGRIFTPCQFRERFTGKYVTVEGCQNHFVVRPAQAPDGFD